VGQGPRQLGQEAHQSEDHINKSAVLFSPLECGVKSEQRPSLQMKNLFKRFAKDQSGATAIEYVLIASLISVAIILGATTLGSKLNTTFNDIAGAVNAPAS
jgi:pilus assembly protein Flp/PilA